MSRMEELLQTFAEIAAPSGFETEIGEAFAAAVQDVADEVRTDALGNVIATLNPDASTKIMLCAHMDESTLR